VNEFDESEKIKTRKAGKENKEFFPGTLPGRWGGTFHASVHGHEQHFSLLQKAWGWGRAWGNPLESR
jgi:hypothetical protein